MKPYIVSVLVFLSAATTRAAVEFNGYIQSNGGHLFVLSDSTQNSVSRWLSLGEQWAGYRISTFDRDSETLTLQKAGEQIRLRLQGATIVASKEVAPARVPVDLQVSENGTIQLGENTSTIAELEALFRAHAARGTPIMISLRQPKDPTNATLETTNAIHLALARSGNKKWRLRIVDWGKDANEAPDQPPMTKANSRPKENASPAPATPASRD